MEPMSQVYKLIKIYDHNIQIIISTGYLTSNLTVFSTPHAFDIYVIIHLQPSHIFYFYRSQTLNITNQTDVQYTHSLISVNLHSSTHHQEHHKIQF